VRIRKDVSFIWKEQGTYLKMRDPDVILGGHPGDVERVYDVNVYKFREHAVITFLEPIKFSTPLRSPIINLSATFYVKNDVKVGSIIQYTAGQDIYFGFGTGIMHMNRSTMLFNKKIMRYRKPTFAIDGLVTEDPADELLPTVVLILPSEVPSALQNIKLVENIGALDASYQLQLEVINNTPWEIVIYPIDKNLRSAPTYGWPKGTGRIVSVPMGTPFIIKNYSKPNKIYGIYNEPLGHQMDVKIKFVFHKNYEVQTSRHLSISKNDKIEITEDETKVSYAEMTRVKFLNNTIVKKAQPLYAKKLMLSGAPQNFKPLQT
jgi:hypothetical protein